MQQAFTRALDRAESVIESAQQRPPKRKYSPSGEKSLHEKLYDIYVEECEKEPEVTEELRSNVNLLEKLVARESLPCLVINLHPGTEGYSLMLKKNNECCSETIHMQYEEGELLEYLDAEELPPVLLDLLEKSEINVFHRGCVIAEIRDYRQSSNMDPPGYQSRHILLRPTMQTLAADVQSIASDNDQWTEEDKLLLESQLLLATAEPLCLDPNVSVACTENRLLYNKQKMNTRPLKRSFKRYSMPSLNRQQELSPCPLPPALRVLKSWGRNKESKAVQQHDLKIPIVGDCVDLWKRRPCDLAIPSEVHVEKYAKGKKSVTCADSQARAWPVHDVKGDSMFGVEARNESQARKPTFMRPIDDPLSSAERSHKGARCERQMSLPDHPSTGDRSNSFMPGSETDAGRVIAQSEELVQKVTCPVKKCFSSGGSTSFSQFPPGKNTQQPVTTLVHSSVLGRGVKHLPLPVKLPPSLGKSSPRNNFIPGQASSMVKNVSSFASKPPSVSQKSSMEVNQIKKIPTATLSTASSSQGMTVMSTTSFPQRTLGLSTVNSSQRTLDLCTASSSQRALGPSSVSSLRRTQTLSTTSFPQRTLGLSTVSSSQRTLNLSTASSSQRALGPSSVNSSRRTQTLSTTSFPQRTLGLSTVSSSQRTLDLSTASSSQRALGPSSVSSSRRTQTLSTVSSSQRTPATLVQARSSDMSVINATGSVPGTQALGGGSNCEQSCTSGATAPAEMKPSNRPAARQPPNVLPDALQEPSQVDVQLFLEDAPNLGPVTLLHLSNGSLVLKTQQLSLEDQWLCHLILQDEEPSTICLQEGPSALESSSVQQAIVINLTGVGSLQSQPTEWSQLDCDQNTPGQGLSTSPQQPSALGESQPQPPQQQQEQVETLAAASDCGTSSPSSATSAAADSEPVHRHAKDVGSGSCQRQGTQGPL